MTLFAFLLSAAIGGGGVVALRERPKPAAAVGLLACSACLLAAVAMPAGAKLTVGTTVLQADAYVRLFLVAAASALLVSQIAGLAHGWQRELPLATLGALGLVGVALTVGTPAAAMLTVAAAGTFVVIASLERAISMPAVRAAASGFRLAVVAGFMGLVAMAITGTDPIFVPPDVLAGAILLMAAAVALRVGAIPVHAPVARLIERARTAALPLLAAWVPAAFAVVALGWTATIVALDVATPIVVVVVAVGVATIVLASAVVLIDDDLVRWLGYGVIADGGFVLLALAADSTAAIAAGLAWLICFALARSIMACVLLGFQGAFDARRTRELDGWLRRTPLLGVALLAGLVLAFGLPGTLPWQVRLDLAQAALGEQLGLALVAVALLPLVPMARLAWTGLLPLGTVVAAGRSERLVLPPRTAAVTSASTADQAGAPGSEAGGGREGTETADLGVGSAAPTEPAVVGAEPADVGAEPAITVPAIAQPAFAEPAIAWSPTASADTLWGATAEPSLPETGPQPDDTATSASRRAPEPTTAPGRAPESASTAELPGTSSASPTTPSPAAADGPSPTTLSGRGRATRAARKAAQPTVVGQEFPAAPTPGDAPAPDAHRDGAASESSGSSNPGGPSRRASALTSMRRVGASASTSAGPLRHALRALPAIWELDRTLVASLATLLLAIVGLAFATDLVGLGTAAGLGAASSPAP